YVRRKTLSGAIVDNRILSKEKARGSVPLDHPAHRHRMLARDGAVKERLVTARVDDLTAVDASDGALDAGIPGGIDGPRIQATRDNANGKTCGAEPSDGERVLLVHDTGVAEKRAVQVDGEQLGSIGCTCASSASARHGGADRYDPFRIEL